jgi:hypothetical protein
MGGQNPVDDDCGDTFFFPVIAPARKSDSGKIFFFGMEDRMARFWSMMLTIPTIIRHVKMRNSVIVLRILASRTVYGNPSFSQKRLRKRDRHSNQREIKDLLPYLFRQGEEGLLFRGISVKLLHEQTKEGFHGS